MSQPGSRPSRGTQDSRETSTSAPAQCLTMAQAPPPVLTRSVQPPALSSDMRSARIRSDVASSGSPGACRDRTTRRFHCGKGPARQVTAGSPRRSDLLNLSWSSAICAGEAVGRSSYFRQTSPIFWMQTRSAMTSWACGVCGSDTATSNAIRTHRYMLTDPQALAGSAGKSWRQESRPRRQRSASHGPCPYQL